MSKERVPNHDHSGFNEGGKLALNRILSVDEADAVSGGATSTASLIVEEDAVAVVSTASVLNATHGLDVTNSGGGVAALAVDESELDIELLSTTETDPALVYSPDGTGGVIARAEASLLGDITDGTVTVADVSTEIVPKGGVTDAGGGNAVLNFLTSVLGEQHKLDTNAASGTAATIDCAIANAFDITLTGNCTFTITNPPAAGLLAQFLVIRRQDGTGSRLETWPGNVYGQASDGTSAAFAPTLYTAANAVNVCLLSTIDGGVTWGATELGYATATAIIAALFATPAIVLGTAAAAGSASTVIRSDATIAAFDTTTPAAIGTAATGSVAKAARRDHVHATGAGTPTTQAFGDSATTGSGPAAAMTDHKHAMPTAAITTSGLTQATGKLLGRSTASTGAVEEITVGTNLTLSAGTLSATGGGTSATDANIWRPLMDGGGNVVTDGSGQAVMAYSPA